MKSVQAAIAQPVLITHSYDHKRKASSQRIEKKNKTFEAHMMFNKDAVI